MNFLEITENKGRVCNDLLRSLPLWFCIEEAIKKYVQDVESMSVFAALDNGIPIGGVQDSLGGGKSMPLYGKEAIGLS